MRRCRALLCGMAHPKLKTPFTGCVYSACPICNQDSSGCQLCVQSCLLRARRQRSCSQASWGTRFPWLSPGTGVRGMQAGSRAFLRSLMQSKQLKMGCTAVKQTSS